MSWVNELFLAYTGQQGFIKLSVDRMMMLVGWGASAVTSFWAAATAQRIAVSFGRKMQCWGPMICV
jgi:hypothetical protein